MKQLLTQAERNFGSIADILSFVGLLLVTPLIAKLIEQSPSLLLFWIALVGIGSFWSLAVLIRFIPKADLERKDRKGNKVLRGELTWMTFGISALLAALLFVSIFGVSDNAQAARIVEMFGLTTDDPVKSLRSVGVVIFVFIFMVSNSLALSKKKGTPESRKKHSHKTIKVANILTVILSIVTYSIFHYAIEGPYSAITSASIIQKVFAFIPYYIIIFVTVAAPRTIIMITTNDVKQLKRYMLGFAIMLLLSVFI